MTDLEFIKSPNEWPKWPLLPVVMRRTSPLQCGLVIADGKPAVYIGANVFTLDEGSLPDALKDFKRFEYNSFESLLIEWRID